MPTIHYTSRKFLERHGVHPLRTTRPSSATNPFLSTLLRSNASGLEPSSSSTRPDVEYTKELAAVSAKNIAVDGTDMNVCEQSMPTQDDGYAIHILLLHFFIFSLRQPSIVLIIFILYLDNSIPYILGMNMINQLGGKGITSVQRML